jgi:hypothetical protein
MSSKTDHLDVISQNYHNIRIDCDKSFNNKKINKFDYGFKARLIKKYGLSEYTVNKLCQMYESGKGDLDTFIEQEKNRGGRPRLFDQENVKQAITEVGQMYAYLYCKLNASQLHFELVNGKGIEISECTTRKIFKYNLHAKCVKMCFKEELTHDPTFTKRITFVVTDSSDGVEKEYLEVTPPMFIDKDSLKYHNPRSQDIRDSDGEIIIYKGVELPSACSFESLPLGIAGAEDEANDNMSTRFYPHAQSCKCICECVKCKKKIQDWLDNQTTARELKLAEKHDGSSHISIDVYDDECNVSVRYAMQQRSMRDNVVHSEDSTSAASACRIMGGLKRRIHESDSEGDVMSDFDSIGSDFEENEEGDGMRDDGKSVGEDIRLKKGRIAKLQSDEEEGNSDDDKFIDNGYHLSEDEMLF